MNVKYSLYILSFLLLFNTHDLDVLLFKIIERRFPNYEILSKNMMAPDIPVKLKKEVNHPGWVIGHFRNNKELDAAVLLVNTKNRHKGAEKLIYISNFNKYPQFRTLESWDQDISPEYKKNNIIYNYIFLEYQRRNSFIDIETGRNVDMIRDGFTRNDFGSNIKIYHWNNNNLIETWITD